MTPLTSCQIQFPDSPFQPLYLPAQSSLSEHLTVQNSPVLFGCRTGICGTCLVQVQGQMVEPTPLEQELLETLVDQASVLPPGRSFRLACQLDCTSDLQIWPAGASSPLAVPSARHLRWL